METRILVKRPYRIKVRCDRIIKAIVLPLLKEIKVEELKGQQIAFDGSPAFDIAHEIEHLKK
jgi:predicted metalloprotease